MVLVGRELQLQRCLPGIFAIHGDVHRARDAEHNEIAVDELEPRRADRLRRSGNDVHPASIRFVAAQNDVVVVRALE